MPSAEFPTSLMGWLITIGASVVGFFAGFVFIRLSEAMLGG